MKPIGGLRKAGDIEPCRLHAGSLIVSCRECRVWWTYREALRTADHWQARFNAERARRVELEREFGR